MLAAQLREQQLGVDRTDEPARVLMVSRMVAPDVTELRETGELRMRDYPPGGEPGANALDVRFPLDWPPRISRAGKLGARDGPAASV